jgi:hypothetical protein
MATSKKAASRKAAGEGSGRGKKGKADSAAGAADVISRWLLRDDGEADHSPIIITDGSASIEFALKGPYTHQGGGNHTSTTLRLRDVTANHKHPASVDPLKVGDPPGTVFCRGFEGASKIRIEVTVRVDGQDEIFEIVGKAAGSSKSPSVKFNIGKFKEDSVNFPVENPKSGRRFGNPNGNITGFRIFSDGDLIHDCPLATKNGVQYTITDPHT